LYHGVILKTYNNHLADNEVFKSNAFVQHINESAAIAFLGEVPIIKWHCRKNYSICLNIARGMYLHASVHWKDLAAADCWPMAINYATYMYNHTPKNGFCSADIFFGGMVPRHHLKDFPVWGCPVFVLDPKLQQGQKLPRWET